MQIKIPLSLLSVALLSQLHAQSIELAPIEVKSSVIKTDELSSSDAIEIYTQEDIESSDAKDIYEFLNSRTSVASMPSYGNPFTQLLDMRGYGLSNGFLNIVVRVNGRSLNNIDNVPQLLRSIAIESIERIEIIKSGGIVLAGDGANGGVINIITKKDAPTQITLFGGVYNTFGASAFTSHASQNFTLTATAQTQASKGYKAIDAAGNTDESKLSNANVEFEFTPSELVAFRLGASGTRQDVIYGGVMSKAQYSDNPAQFAGWTSHQKLDSDTLTSGVTLYINETLSLGADASKERKKSDYVPSYGPSFYEYDAAKLTLDYETDGLEAHLGLEQLLGERRQSASTTSKDSKSLFALASFTFGATDIKAGARGQKVSYSHEDASVSLSQDKDLYGFELGASHMLSQNSSIFLSYAHAYQAPNIDMFFATTYAPPTWSAQTNFNSFIEPMKSDSITVGYNSITNQNKLKIAAFYTMLKDEIYLYKNLSNPFDFGTNTNIDKSHKYGVDIFDRYIISEQFDITFNYNYVAAVIDDEKGSNGEDYAGNTLPGVGNHNVKATLSYLPSSHAVIALTQVYRSEAYAADDFANNFAQKQEAYRSTDLSATYTKESYELFAKINNLFNQKNGLWIKDDAIYPVNFTTTAIAGFKLKY